MVGLFVLSLPLDGGGKGGGEYHPPLAPPIKGGGKEVGYQGEKKCPSEKTR